MPEIRLRPMTGDEFARDRSRLVTGYAAEHVGAGDWRPEEAEALAAEETDRLLPGGADSPGMLLRAAETADGKPAGIIWIALEHRSGSAEGGWIYDIEVAEHLRGKGYGRALLAAGEQEAARHGVEALGLNVFGSNAVARRLYESSGYEISTLQMRKRLAPPA
ncbi:MAG TPA: GNAT family N-acetyltransferase [Acidimicrobiales bacterium]|nr:GNAT family N-acetyltransferase [Acidimicrobiales bacterium]